MKQLPTGVLAPDFELHTLEGQTFRLSEAVLAAPVVLAFFKISCPTCQFSFPYLQRIYSETGVSSSVKMLGISQDETAETTGFVKNFGIGFDILIEEYPYRTSAAYNLEYVPGLFIVGQDGTIQLSDYGFSKAALTEIARIVGEHAGKAPPVLFPANDGLPATRPG